MLRYPPAGAAVVGGANPFGLTQLAGQTVAGQVDIVFAITKSAMRCMSPFCNKPLCPWTTCPRDNRPFFCRLNHQRHHAGMRGAAGTGNLVCGYGCPACANKGAI